MPRIVLENLFRCHLADGLGNAGAHQVDDIGSPDEVHQGDDYQPNKQRTAADNEGILQADDIAQAQHGRASVHLEHQLGFIGHRRTPAHYRGGDGFGPGSEGGYGEVVQAADEARADERLGAGPAAFAADEHLRGGSGLRERILPVHFLHKILAERNQEQDTQHAAQQGTQDHLPELDLHSQDIDGRQGKDGSRHHCTAAAADTLDNHILRKALLETQGAREAHGDDGNGDGSLEYLAHLQAQICSGGAEQDYHQDADAHRIRRGLGILFRGGQKRLILFARSQLPVSVLRERKGLLLLHNLAFLNLEQVQETCHHEHLADFVVDVTDNHLSALAGGSLTDGEENTESGAADVRELLAVQHDGLVGLLDNGLQGGSHFLGNSRVQTTDQLSGHHIVFFSDFYFHGLC